VPQHHVWNLRELHFREVIEEHHRGCISALANLQTLVAGDSDTVLRVDVVRGIDRAMRVVSEELRMAEKGVVDALAGTARERPAALLLGGRLSRLEAAADDVGEAVGAKDIGWLRRRLTRFDVLARTTCAIQLDVYTSAMTNTLRPDLS
jgi:hypothetical protein